MMPTNTIEAAPASLNGNQFGLSPEQRDETPFDFVASSGASRILRLAR